MHGFDNLLNRLTDRLRIDPELRLEVRQELRTHIEDSAAEFRQACDNDEQAAAQAVKALGNEQELAKDLWRANRRRIRVHTWVKSALPIVLWPAIAIVVAWMPLSGYLANQRTNEVLEVLQAEGLSLDAPQNPDRPLPPIDPEDHPLLRNLSEDDRFILLGDSSAATRLAKAKSIADRWPQDPVYYAAYATLYLREVEVDRKANRQKPGKRLDESVLGPALAVLDRGMAVDPDNALYPLIKADYLFTYSTDYVEDGEREYLFATARRFV